MFLIKYFRYILIGNKTDQLPIDGPNHTKRWKLALTNAITQYSKIPEKYIIHTVVISALNGFGINSIIDYLLNQRGGLKCNFKVLEV